MDKKAKIAIFSALLLVSILIVGLAIASPKAKPVRGKPQCNDGLDNDNDGYTDWPADPGCVNKNDKSELNPTIECDDGLDNDGDNNIDMADTGCSSPSDNDETDCGDGVCEGPETQGNCPADCGEPDSCGDTDSGNLPFTFGTTSGYYNNEPYSNDDYCVDTSNIVEYYCSSDYEQSQQQSCGADLYVGDNYCMNNSVYKDWRDYACASGECDYSDTPTLQEQCDYGCTNGECILIPDSCHDSDDGFNLFVQGIVSGNSSGVPYYHVDYCLNSSTILIEYYCSGDNCGSQQMNCIYQNATSCSNGACV